MNKIDQYLELLDNIAPVYGKILDFSFFFVKPFIILASVKTKIAMWETLLKD